MNSVVTSTHVADDNRRPVGGAPGGGGGMGDGGGGGESTGTEVENVVCPDAAA